MPHHYPDAPAIASHLLALLDDTERSTALGTAGRERAHREFSVDRMTDRTVAVYRSALEN